MDIGPHLSHGTLVMQVTGGRNGYGAKLANIFSTEFVIETCDGTRGKRYRQVFRSNMTQKETPKVTHSLVVQLLPLSLSMPSSQLNIVVLLPSRSHHARPATTGRVLLSSRIWPSLVWIRWTMTH